MVDTQAHGLLNIWQLATRLYPEKQSWMMVDIGVTQTSLGLIPQNGVPFFKDIAFGTQALYQTEGSGEVASTFGSAQQTQAFTVSLIEKLKRQFQLYASVNSMQSLKGIWLMGEGADTPLLAEQLERHFQLACESLNPLALFENKASNKRYKSMDRHAFGIETQGLRLGSYPCDSRKLVSRYRPTG